MKKLMIAAAIVCAAAFANAGTFMWGVSDVAAYGSDGSSDGYQAWLIQNYAGTITGDNLASVIATYGAADDWGGIESGATDGSSSSFGADETVNAFVLVINSDDVATADHFYVTTTQTTASNGMEVFDPPSLTFDASSSSSAGAWTATAVPEPTSGLLLLLGVAGLALRRRRA